MSVSCSVSNHLDPLIDIIGAAESLGDLQKNLVKYVNEHISDATDKIAVDDLAEAFTILGGSPEVREILIGFHSFLFTSWLSPQTASDWILGQIHPGEISTQDDLSKIDAIDTNTELEDKNRLQKSFLMKAYGGNSSAKADLLRRFDRLATSMFFVKLNGEGEITTQEDFESNIIDATNSLYSSLRKAAIALDLPGAKTLPIQLMVNDNEKKTRDNWKKYKKVTSGWKEILDYNPAKINDVAIRAKAGDAQLQNILEVFQSNFILTHFDELLTTKFGDSFEIKVGAGEFTGVTFNGIHKYYKADNNTHMRVSWVANDEEQTNALAETSEHLRAFFDGMMITSINPTVAERSTSMQEIASTWVAVKAKIRTSTPIRIHSEISMDELGKYFTPRELKLLMEQTVPGEEDFGIKAISLQALMSNASADPEIARLLIKALGYNGENPIFDMIGFTEAQRSIFYSLYNTIFSENSPLYQSFVRSQNNPTIGKAPKNYYEWFTDFFGNLSKIDMNQLTKESDGTLRTPTLGDNGLNSGAFQYQTQRAAKFSATVDFKGKDVPFVRRGKSFYFTPTSLTKENKYLDIMLPGHNDEVENPNMLIRRHSNGKIEVFNEAGDKVSINNITTGSPLFKALQDFYFEVLGLDHYDRNQASAALGNEALTVTKLVDLASDILYNYSVSYNLLGKTVSKKDYLKEAGAYFADEKMKKGLKLQRDGSDLESVSRRNTPTLVSLVNVTDFLEGRIRSTVVKSADGTSINTISTSQLAYSAYDQWMRALREENYACAGFSLFGAYKGLEFARDVKWGADAHKRVSAFSEAEMFGRNFLAGYLVPTYSPADVGIERVYRIIPMVISDKVRIPDVKIDMDAINPVVGKTWAECTEEDIRKTTEVELGGYYEKAHAEFSKRFGVLQTALTSPQFAGRISSFGNDTANGDVDFYLAALLNVKSADFGYSEGFAGLNEITRAFKDAKTAEFNTYFAQGTATFDRNSPFFEAIRDFALSQTYETGLSLAEIQTALILGHNTKVSGGAPDANTELFEKFRESYQSSITDRAKTAIGNVMHELTARGKRLGMAATLPANSSYVMLGNGFVHVNPVLVDQLYRWGKISARKAQSLLPKGVALESGEGTAKEFFEHKAQQTLKDILQDNGSIVLSGQALKAAGNADFFPEGSPVQTTCAFGNRYVLGVITYQGRDSEGNITTFTEHITDRGSFENSYIAKLAFNYLRYQSGDDSFQYNSTSEWFQSPDFSFDKFENAAQKALAQRETLIKSKKAFDAYWLERKDRLNTSLQNTKAEQIAKKEAAIEEAKARVAAAITSGITRDIRTAEQHLAHLTEELATYNQTQDLYIADRLAEFESVRKEEAKKYKELKKNSKEIKDTAVKVHTNPQLSRFNAISFLFGQEYTIATVGSHINHPSIKSLKKGLKAMEALSFQQQTKRNVSLTATKNKYHLNRWNGFKDHHKVCIISNTKDAVYNLTGTQDDVFNDDGACYTAGVAHYWENNSLGPNAVGIDKKTFFHMHDSGLGTGYIGKDAGFTGNNNRIRASLFYAYLNYRMLSDPDQELIQYQQNGGLDITHRYGITRDPITGTVKYGGERIAFSDFAYEKVLVRDKNGNVVPQLNANFGANWELIPEHAVVKVIGDSVEFDASTGTTNFRAEVYYDGQMHVVDLSTQLKNVFDIWNFFGGAYSGKMSSDGTIKQEDYNDLSTQYTAEVCSLVGERINGTGEHDVISSQSQVKQFLKDSVVVYMPTVESVKQGAACVNDVSQIDNFDYVMTTMDMDLHDSGVQLNAEHHADDTVISMMTQVLNALGARGYTATEGDRTYQALRALTETNLKGYIDSIRSLATGEAPSDEVRAQLTNFIAQIITKTIRSADLDDGTLVAALTFQARNALEHKAGNLNYEEIMQYIPIDDLGLLRAEMSKISSELVKSCIKVKFPGSMDVLSPSNGRFLLYDGKMLDQYKGDLASLKAKDANAQINAHRNTHAIRLGTTYRLSLGKSEDIPTDLSTFMLGNVNPDGTIDVKVNTPAEYWAIQDFLMRNDDVRISEVYSAGRDLAAYGVTFMTEGPAPEQYQIWDLAVVHDLYNKTLTGTKEQKREALIKLQAVLSSLSSDPNFTEAEVRYFNTETQTWETKQVKINKKSVNVSPYEVIMSMHDQEQFGLKVGDDVKTISENKLFFLERFIQENFSGEGENDNYFDFELRSIDKKHRLWLSLDDKPVDTGYFTLVSDNVFEDDSDPNNIVYWQMDFAGNKVRRLASKDDKIYRGAAGETLIVSKTPEFYIDSNSHASLTISTRVAERDPDTLIRIFDEHLLHCDNSNVRNFIKRFKMHLDKVTEEEVDEDTITVEASDFVKQLGSSKETIAKELEDFITIGRNRFTQALNTVKTVLAGDGTAEEKLAQLVGRGEDGKYKVPDGKVRDMISNTLETHTSFLKSLEVLAARIPAQCMQSFMAMKIVGFDRSGVNTAYVSRFQIYLQGSDFDIDKVSLLGFKFRNGKFVTWSPFMDISSIENLEASLSIPFPTGRAFTAIADSTKRCSLGDNILYGLKPGVQQDGDNLVYIMRDSSGNVLYELVPQREIDPRYNDLPTEDELWTAFKELSALTEDETKADTLKSTLQVFAHDGYTVNGITLKVNEFIPEDILSDIDSGNSVSIVKLRSVVLDGVKEAARQYTSASQIKSYQLVLNPNITDKVVKQAIQRSLVYITKEGQSLLVDEAGEHLLGEYGFDVQDGVATRSSTNISAARDFLDFMESHSGKQGSGALFIKEGGKFTLNTGANYKGNKEQLLHDLGTFIQAVNDFEGIPQFEDPKPKSKEARYNDSIEDILKEINKHNLSLSRSSRNLQDALINFISTSMYSVSKNPINQIQAQSSVDASDGAVNLTKKMAAESEYSKKLLDFNPGSITSMYRMTKLTLGGKTNVGITASSLKTFEGLTQYVYNVLNHGTAERNSALLTDRTFVGQRVQLIANPYQQNKQNFLPFDVYLALQEAAERGDFDAFLWYSGILSLSTDNAKDPTTVKINAGEKMLALYLAGLAVGVDMEALIPIMTSRAGILINSLMESNIFTGQDGLFDVTAVINFIDKPENFIGTLSETTLKLVYDAYAKVKYAGKKGKEAIPKFERGILNDAQFIKFFMSNANRIISQELTKATITEDQKKVLNRNLRKFNDYANTVKTIKGCTIEYNGEKYSPYTEIKKLNAVLQEMRIFSQIGKLNQSLPNTIADQLVWKEKFESAISKRLNSMSPRELHDPKVKKAQERLKELNAGIGMKGNNLNSRIDFMNFVENPEYRQGVIEVYDALKVVVNPYAAMSELAHYFGYMQTAAALFRVNEASNVYKTTEYIVRHVTSLSGTQEQKTKQVTRILDWINDNLIADFLRKSVAPIKTELPEDTDFEVYQKSTSLQMSKKPIKETSGTIVLGSDEGNATFKVLMEEVIIPRLQETQVNNPLLDGLVPTKYDKTYDKNFIIKTATATSGSPNAEFEQESLAKYKAGLHKLKDVTLSELGGMSAIDALFLYNLIVNGGKVGQTTLSMVFEDYAISQGKNSEEFGGYGSAIIEAYYDSRKLQESELLEEITKLTPEAKKKLELSLAVEDYAFTTGADYIIRQNPETRKYEILYNKRKAEERARRKQSGEDDSELADAVGSSENTEEQSTVDPDAFGEEESGRRSYKAELEDAGYVVVGKLNSGKLARALIVPSMFSDESLSEKLYENPMTGEIRLRQDGKLIKFKNLMEKLTPNARQQIEDKKITDMKGLLKLYGFISGDKKIKPTPMFETLTAESLIEYLTNPQC